MLPRRVAPPAALLQANLAVLDVPNSPYTEGGPLTGPMSSRASTACEVISIVSMADPTSVSDRRETTQAASSYRYLETTQRQLLSSRKDAANRRQSSFPSKQQRSGTMLMDPQSMIDPREHVEFHKTEEEYGLTKEEREWLRGLYEKYRQEVPHEDALKELLWNVDRDSMDDQQLHSKLQGTFPAQSLPLQQGFRVRSVSPSASTTSPQTTALNWTDFTMPLATDKEAHHPTQPSAQLPMSVLSFEQLLDYAVMVKTQCAARNVSDQMTLDAFVLLGGCEDGSGEVQLDTLRQTILDFNLNIDVESFVSQRSPSASTTSPQTTALNWTDFTMPLATDKEAHHPTPQPSAQLPMSVLSFEQLLDYAVMVKTQCAARNVSDQMTLDAFVLLGGCEDGSGEVQLDTLRQTILDFNLNIDVESFVAAVDKDGDGTIMYHEFAWLYNEGLMDLTTSPSSALVTKTPSNFFAPVTTSINGGDAGSDSAGAKGSRNVSPIVGLTSPSLHSVVKLPAETPNHPASAKLEALQVLSRASVARALSVNVDFQGVSPSKRGAHHLHNKQRTRPQAVPCRDLADPDTVLQRLEDVGVTHEHRIAYSELTNRRHLRLRFSQGNQLLADNVNDLFFKRQIPTTTANNGDGSHICVTPAATAAPSEVSITPRRQRVALKPKVDSSVPRSAVKGPPSPRRPPTVAELVQRKLDESSTSRSSACREHRRLKSEGDPAAAAAAEVQQAMETLQIALQKLDLARQQQQGAAALSQKLLHQPKAQQKSTETSTQIAVTNSASNVFFLSAASDGDTPDCLQKLDVARQQQQQGAAASSQKLLHQAKAQQKSTDTSTQIAVTNSASNAAVAAAAKSTSQIVATENVPAATTTGGNTGSHTIAAQGGNDEDTSGEYDDDEFEATDVSAHNTTVVGKLESENEPQSSASSSSSRSSSRSSRSRSNSSRSFSIASSSSRASVRSTSVDGAQNTHSAPAQMQQPEAVLPVKPHAPPAAASTRSSRLRHAKQHPEAASAEVATHAVPTKGPTRPPSAAKHHLLLRRPQTASSQSRLCRTTGRAYDDDKLSRIPSAITSMQNQRVISAAKHHLLLRRPHTASSQSRLCRTTGRAYEDDKLSRIPSAITSMQNQRVMDALKRCAAEGNGQAVSLVPSTSHKKKGSASVAAVGGAQLTADDQQLMDRWTRR
ncbi:Hypothetical protein, putative [Bodo saltans]|uniref:EF-hand domain-containing protein n=1 Tax=Bodo saltans TaxID=75058 RepID=A0A0S4J3W6_BODSA|nr:Hypothetical protein, putative [Bodo saltans]|eukprot:CUG63006.1 Hypothetical protein, putative [Bodo saltans]